MPVKIQLDNLPMGVAASCATGGDKVTVLGKEYLSSEDGNDLISRLEGASITFPSVIGPSGTPPSQIDNFLAIIGKDKTATVYCNELSAIVEMRPKTRIQKGDHVFKDDIADIRSVEFRDQDSNEIKIPPDHGFELIFSHGWRKSIYYDFTVFFRDAPDRTDDLPILFGRFLSNMMFQEIYRISEKQWEKMTSLGWFPFIWMSDADRKKLIGFCDLDDPPASVFEEICNSFKAIVQGRIESWKTSQLLGTQQDFVAAALGRYLEGDYVSCISVLYPRIEGVLRGLHVATAQTKATQSVLASNLVRNQFDHSLLLPRRFQTYLMEFYFQAFDQRAGNVPLSRHTIGHGVSKAGDYDFIKASLGFMILDQMFYYLVN